MRIVSFRAEPLCVPLLEPFVIATARIDATRAALVRATVDAGDGRLGHGLGEAAALPPVTREDQPELLTRLARAQAALEGVAFDDLPALSGALDECLGDSPAARAGAECALLDAWARIDGVPLCTWLSGLLPRALCSDITLPIAAPEHMAELAVGYRARGFHTFKVKVGKSLDGDLRALSLVCARVPGAKLRLDANAGFTAAQALSLLGALRERDVVVECFEQPCAAEDLAGMAEVTARGGVAVVADESVKTVAELPALLQARAAHGVNLKLAKAGGLLRALALGRAAQAAGLRVMCGGMVETRLGMSAMAHVACALPHVDYVDLDTAFLLASDPFDGGYLDDGPRLRVLHAAGLGVAARAG